MYIVLLTDRRGLGLPMAALRSHRGSRRIVARIDRATFFEHEGEAREEASDFNLNQSKWRAIVYRHDLPLSEIDATCRHLGIALAPSLN